MFDRCSISHFLSPICDLPFPILYFYVPFRWSFVHLPWLLARPGGMRGAIQSAALVVDKSWRVRSKAQVRNCRSQLSDLRPSKSPPAPPRIPPGHPTPTVQLILISLGTRRAKCKKKKMCRPGSVTNMHQKCKLQVAAFMLFMLQLTFTSHFFKNVVPAQAGSIILQNDVMQF